MGAAKGMWGQSPIPVAPGDRFGYLTVVEDGPGANALVVCECGVRKLVVRRRIRSGQVRSCGCMTLAMASSSQITHGHSRRRAQSPTFGSWSAMLQRCLNPRSTKYPLYGGRGITVCERWRTFANFLADMGERPEGKTIDRIDNDGNYEPGNCRWATANEQSNNRRPYSEWRKSA